MGNKLTENVRPGYVPPEIKWKTGVINKPLQSSFYGRKYQKTNKTYENLVTSRAFKQNLITNFDDHYLISSVLECTDEENSLLERSVLQRWEDKDKDSAKELIERFFRAVQAGFEVDPNEVLEITSLQMKLLENETMCSPFQRSFLLRLSLMKNILLCTGDERLRLADNVTDLHGPTTSLNSSENPALKPMNALKSLGLRLLKAFPACYKALEINKSFQEIQDLLEAIQIMCTSLAKLTDLELFSSWCVKLLPDVIPLYLDDSIITENGVQQFNHLNSIKWSYGKGRSILRIDFVSPQDIHQIQISWPNNIHQLPRKMNLRIKTSEETGYIQSDPKKCINHYRQNYLIKKEGVLSIEIFCIGDKLLSQNVCKVELTKFEKTSFSLDSKVLVEETIDNLYPLLELPYLSSYALSAIISLVRACGSIKLILRLVRFMIDKQDSEFFRNALIHNSALAGLCVAIENETANWHNKIKDPTLKESFHWKLCLTENSLNNCTSADQGTTIVHICDIGHVHTVNKSSEEKAQSLRKSQGYGLFSQIVKSGVYEWDIQLSCEQEGVLDDCGICIGVALPNLSKTWMMHCTTGRFYPTSSTSMTMNHQGEKRTPIISCNDICHFRYDTRNKLLTLSINNVYQGVIFENLPNEISPFVLFGRPHVAVSTITSSNDSFPITRKVCILHSAYYPSGSVQSSIKSVDQTLTHLTESIVLSNHVNETIAMEETSDENIQKVNNGSEMLIHSLAKLADTIIFQIQSNQNKRVSDVLRSRTIPYASEVSLHVISEICQLCKNFWTDPIILNKLLRILELQFLHQQFNKLPFEDLENLAETALFTHDSLMDSSAQHLPYRSDSQDNGSIMRSSYNIIHDLSSYYENKQVQQSAITAFSHGFRFFLPTITERISTALHILSHATKNSDEVSPSFTANIHNQLDCDELEIYLIKLVVNKLISSDEIIEMLDECIRSDAFCDTLLELLHRILLIDFIGTCHAVESLMPGSTSPERSLLPLDLRVGIVKFLVNFQEHLMYEICKHNMDLPETKRNLMLLILQYSKHIFKYCQMLLDIFHPAFLNSQKSQSIWKTEDLYRSSLVNVVLFPLLHMICISNVDFEVVQAILPILVVTLERLNKFRSLERCCNAEYLLYSTFINGQKTESSKSDSAAGWKQIPASFYEANNSFLISNDGSMFSSVQSNNTCALLNVSFNNTQKAAWEFLLINDTLDDECSVFGAARLPLSNRNYTSSPDMWMRRAYNGYLYSQGVGREAQGNQIHPGNVVRTVWDGPAGTLSFSINGSENEISFTDIEDEISPCCGSYRSGVVIQIVKVEIFMEDTKKMMFDNDNEHDFDVPSKEISWVLDDGKQFNKTILRNKAHMSKVTEDFAWLTARGNKGSTFGVRDWSFEFGSDSDSPFAIGIVIGTEYDESSWQSTRLGYSLEANKFESKNKKSLISINKKVFESLGLDLSGVMFSQFNGHKSSDSRAAAVVEPGHESTMLDMDHSERFDIGGKEMMYMMAWHSDGTLWFNGKKVAVDFGLSVLPIHSNDVVTMRIDHTDRTVSFRLNGESIGVAFGPHGSGAAAIIPLPHSIESLNAGSKHSLSTLRRSTAFPAASIFSFNQSITLRASGFNGSTVLPLSLAHQKGVSSVIGCLLAQVMIGPPITESEQNLQPWFSSPLFGGGFKPNHPEPVRESSSFRNLSELESLNDTNLNTEAASEAFLDLFLHGTMDDAMNESHSETAIADIFLNWLENIDPESEVLRSALQKSGGFKFPFVELPFIACLIVHGGLIDEAMEVIRQLDRLESVVPSEEMGVVCQRLKQLRFFLRQQRQRGFAIKHIIEEGSTWLSTPDIVSVAQVRSVGMTSFEPINSADQETYDLTYPLDPLSDSIRVQSPFVDNDLEYQRFQEAIRQFLYKFGWNRLWVNITDSKRFDSGVYTVSMDLLSEQKDSMLYTEDYILNHLVPDQSINEGISISRVGFDFERDFIFIQYCSDKPLQIELVIHSNHLSACQYSELFHYGKVVHQFVCFDVNSSGLDSVFNSCDESITGKIASLLSNIHLVVVLSDEFDPFKSLLHLQRSANSVDSEGFHSNESQFQDDPFKILCRTLRDKAMFLLELNPIFGSNREFQKEESKSFLLNLSKQFAGSGIPLSTTKVDSSRWKSQERWKRIIEFLHLHTKIRKHLSGNITGRIDLPPSNINQYETTSFASLQLNAKKPFKSLGKTSASTSEDDINASQTVIQACCTFITSEKLSLGRMDLHAIRRRQEKRCLFKATALKQLEELISSTNSLSDPCSTVEILQSLRSLLDSAAVSNFHAMEFQSTLQGDFSINFEGSDTLGKQKLRTSYNACFCAMSKLVSNQISYWEELNHTTEASSSSTRPQECHFPAKFSFILMKPVRMLLELTAVLSSSSDENLSERRKHIQSTGRLLSLLSVEQAVQRWNEAVSTHLDILEESCELYPKYSNWNLWSQKVVLQNLQEGLLHGRDLLLHMLQVPSSILKKEELQNILCMEASEKLSQLFTRGLSVEDIHLKYMKFMSHVNQRQNLIQSKSKMEQTSVAIEKSKLDNEKLERLLLCGVFDSTMKDSSIELDEFQVIARKAGGEATPSCVLSNIEYDAVVGPQPSGNYFEITVLSAMDVEIVIGLGDRSSFLVSNCYPGQMPHSYGYDGKTGCLFGDHQAVLPDQSNYSPFVVGDVIGCGYDMKRRSIFYTLNGVRLSNAFVDIPEDKLTPIIGFGNADEIPLEVNINFGTDVFKYEIALNLIDGLTIGNNADILHHLAENGLHVKREAFAERLLMESQNVFKPFKSELPENGNASHVVVQPDQQTNEVIEDLHFHIEDTVDKNFNDRNFKDRFHESMMQLKQAENRLLNLYELRYVGRLLLRTSFFLACQNEDFNSSSLTEDGLQTISNSIAADIKNHIFKEAKLCGRHQLNDRVFYRSPLDTNSNKSKLLYAIGTEVVELQGYLNELLWELLLYSSQKIFTNSQMLLPDQLTFLFQIFPSSSSSNQLFIFRIFHNTLPQLSPEFVNMCLSRSMIDTVDSYRQIIKPIVNKRTSTLKQSKIRRSPDTAIQYFLIYASEFLKSFPFRSDSINSNVVQAYGSGDIAINRADECLQLIRLLFETSSWTELIAFRLTENLQHALNYLENDSNSQTIVALPSLESSEIDTTMIKIEAVACATLSCLTGLGILRDGQQVEILSEDGRSSKAHLLSWNDSINQSEIVIGNFSISKNIQVVELSKLKPVFKCVDVDVTNISQPLILAVFNIWKWLTDWIHNNIHQFIGREFSKMSGTVTESYEKMHLRLASIATQTIAVFLDQQPEAITELLNNPSVISLLLTIATQPTGSDHFVTADYCHKMWTFNQSRLFEMEFHKAITGIGIVSNEVVNFDNVRSDRIETQNHNVIPEGDKSDLPIIIDNDNRQTRMDIANEMSQELHMDSKICLMYLEYNMMNRSIASKQLKSLQYKSVNLDPLNISVPQHHPFKVNLSNDNPLRMIEYCSSSPIRTIDTNPPSILHLHDIEHYSTEVMDLRYIVESEGDGMVSRYKNPIMIHNRSTHEPTLNPKEIIVKIYDPKQDTVWSKLISTDQLKEIKAFYNKNLDSINLSICSLDINLIILRIRKIIFSMIKDGSLQSKAIDNGFERWILLMKLITVSGPLPSMHLTLGELCTALIQENLSPTLTSERRKSITSEDLKDDGNSLININTNPSPQFVHSNLSQTTFHLIQDFQTNMIQLSECSLNNFMADALEQSSNMLNSPNNEIKSKPTQGKESIVVESPHPFTTPASYVGLIQIPAHWKGAHVTFHPKSCTPGPSSQLQMFDSKSRFENNTPDHVFCGSFSSLSPTADAPFVFKNFYVQSADQLAFRFTAKHGSELPPVPMSSMLGATLIDSNYRVYLKSVHKMRTLSEVSSSQDVVKAVGLGDDDSLFNLFVDEKNGDTQSSLNPGGLADGVDEQSVEKVSEHTELGIGTAVAALDFKRAGMWYFECVVHLKHDSLEGPENNLTSSLNKHLEEDQMNKRTKSKALAIVGMCQLKANSTAGNPPDYVTNYSFASDDYVRVRGRRFQRINQLDEWMDGDVIQCLLQVEEAEDVDIISPYDIKSDEKTTNLYYRVCFGINGKWMFQPNNGEETSSLTLPPFITLPKIIRPFVTVTEHLAISFNFGHEAFLLSPDDHIVQQLSKKSYLSAGALMLEEESNRALSWGFKFKVHPTGDIHFQLCKDFELVWSSKPDDLNSMTEYFSTKLASKSKNPIQKVWIWRAKPQSKDFRICGDIITLHGHPPRRSVTVDRSQCKPPASFKCVFLCNKRLLSVWRPIPPKGYVALGDISWSSTGSSPPLDIYGCVPLWAVKECSVEKALFHMKRSGADSKPRPASVWKINSGLGFFFGSSTEKRYTKQLNPEDSKVIGVGIGYRLNNSIESILNGEWSSESDVMRLPSMFWVCNLMQSLLDNPNSREMVIASENFLHLVNFLRSNATPAPHKIVPLIIRIIRLSYRLNVKLPLDEVRNLCKAIITQAINLTQGDKRAEISNGLMLLVDLVVEVQAAHIFESMAAEQTLLSSKRVKPYTPVRHPQLMNNGTESKEEEKLKIETKETDARYDTEEMIAASLSTIPSKMVGSLDLYPIENIEATSQKTEWWDRKNLLPSDMKQHRVIKYENLDILFGKESMLLRLTQVLKFLFAVGSSPFTSKISDDLSTNSQMQENSLDHVVAIRHYPKHFTSKIWMDHASNIIFEESRHPYDSIRVEKKLSFPCAEKLTVVFDRRCSLSKGDRLTLRDSNSTVTFTMTSSTSISNNGISHKVFPGNQLHILFEPASSRKIDSQLLRIESNSNTSSSSLINWFEEFGWAVVVFAHGPLYEHVSCEISIPSEVDSIAGICNDQDSQLQPYDESKLIKTESTSNVVEQLITIQDGTLYGTRSISESVNMTSNLVDPVVNEMCQGATFEENSVDPSNALDLTKDFKNISLEKVRESIIATSGILVKEGVLRVPHASNIDVTIKIQRDTELFVNFGKEYLFLLSQSEVMEQKDGMNNVDGNQAYYKFLLNILTNDMMLIAFKLNLSGCKEHHAHFLGDSIYYCLKALSADRIDQQMKQYLKWHSDALSVSNNEGDVQKKEAGSEVIEVRIDNTIEVQGEWKCIACTVENEKDAGYCGVCSSLRYDVSLWSCTACTFINSQDKTMNTCEVCHNHRGKIIDTKRVKDIKISSGKSVEAKEDSSIVLQNDSKSVSKILQTSTKAQSLVKSNKETQEDVIVITVKGHFTMQDKFETKLEGSILSKGKILTPYEVHARLSQWSEAGDNALLEYLNVHRKAESSSSSSQSYMLALPKQYLSYRGSSLSQMTMLDIQMRMLLVEAFNKNLEYLLPVVDLSNEDTHSLGAMIRKSNRYLLLKVKQPILEKAISATATPSGSDVPAVLTLDNFKSIQSQETGSKDPFTSQNCFVQAFRQLHKKDSKIFRYSASGDRVFQVGFIGESGIDAGGVCREGLSRILDDLFSEHFNLFCLCPNGVQEVHINVDKYLPNPSQLHSLGIEMLEFVGKLMGMSIRSKLCLPFEFPGVIWKKLVGETVNIDDLSTIDIITSKLIHNIRHCDTDFDDPVVNDEQFQMKYGGKLHGFVYTGTDGVERPLKNYEGMNLDVTFMNRKSFCDALEDARLSEFDVPVMAMRKGLGEVIPLRALLLFSSIQLEELVCGSPMFNIELWKKNTEVSGLSQSTVNLFWKVLESLSQKEMAGFLRFVWGRSRLPHEKDFTVKMRLTNGGKAMLPVSHTCFFSVELPEYETEKQMRHGLLTAIHYGVVGILNA